MPASHLVVLDRSIAPVMVSLAAATAIVLVGLHFALNRWQPPLRWAHPLGFAVAMLCLSNSLLHIYRTAAPWQTTNVLLLVVGAGFLLLSFAWLAVTLAMAWAGWGLVVWLSPPSPQWLHFGLALAIATVLSVVVHVVRVRTLRRLELMRLEQEEQNAKLEGLLAETDQARKLAEKLNRLGRALTSTLDLNEVLERVLENAASIVPFDRGSVMLLRGNDVEIVAARGFPPKAQPLQIRMSLLGEDNDIFRYIHLTQQSLAIPDVAERPDCQYVPGTAARAVMAGRAVASYVPSSGCCRSTRETPHPFYDDQMTLAMAFASQAAMALENARLYDGTLQTMPSWRSWIAPSPISSAWLRTSFVRR